MTIGPSLQRECPTILLSLPHNCFARWFIRELQQQMRAEQSQGPTSSSAPRPCARCPMVSFSVIPERMLTPHYPWQRTGPHQTGCKGAAVPAHSRRDVRVQPPAAARPGHSRGSAHKQLLAHGHGSTAPQGQVGGRLGASWSDVAGGPPSILTG